MKYLYVLSIIVCLVIGIIAANYFFLQKTTQKTLHIHNPVTLVKHPSAAAIVTPFNRVTETLFIPYWTLSKENIDDSNYDITVYFGVTADKNGIDTNEPGYAAIDQFLSETNSAKKRLLAVRMINSDINSQVLHDPSLQKNIIEQSIKIARDKGFNGIVLDFEISAIGFDNITKEITKFEIQSSQLVKQQNLQFYTTIYGDTFFRSRPFDIKSIGQASDGIMIMTYDFHKANGDPGPNFQLHDSQNDGYDLTQMIQQFASTVSPQKITVVFGMYGYDWQVDSNQSSMKTADSVSDNVIKQKFLNSCQFKNCKVIHDPQSTETKITYSDENNNNHIIWFEDTNSVDKKTEFLQSQGISSIAYWAYSYF